MLDLKKKKKTQLVIEEASGEESPTTNTHSVSAQRLPC